MPGTVTLENIKSQPISFGLVLTMILGAWPAVGWFNEYHSNFISRVEASQQIEEHLSHLEQKVDRNTDTLTDFQKEVRIRYALGRVETLEARLYTLRRDSADPDLIHELEGDLDHARTYADCLLADRPNCRHLEPGRSR